ncbi:DUF2778 domain-containing protein [Ciceribacter sp. L1K23]|uniref:DUF2778 domain-containing protein n=1 Tax=Ciceribacter sp. L1K23 TaxID=2820276 RepID=UPI002010C8EC|nr:DUF2778 domain-containing protein [Ciceribacter sp. L1K23]
MASSKKSSRDGIAAGRSAPLLSRFTAGGLVLAAAASGVVVVGAAVLALGTFSARPLDGSSTGPLVAAVEQRPAAISSGPQKAGRYVEIADEHSFEEAHERMMAALAVTEDPAIAVLPGDLTLASVDKSTRPQRPSVIGDETALAILKEAMEDAADQRTARLALASELGKQNLKLSSEATRMASLRTGGDADAGETASGTMLAYAPSQSSADVMSDAAEDDPFNRVLSGVDEAEAGLIEDIPVPLTKPEIPAPRKLVPSTTKPSKLALAKPDSPIVEEDDKRPSLFGRKTAKLPGRGSRIAVYDITAGIVYMPNGEKIPASSGRGQYRDNPKYVHVKNRGSTPPNVYKLRMRESLFHGVEAIRMLPVGDAKMYGRDGFLTHSYLLRVPGDSSGCVVFPDYKRFLNAFKRGEVATLIVVPRMAELPRYLAML